MGTRDETTAAGEYARRARDIARLIGLLASELDAHARRAALVPRHRGYADDLVPVRSHLVGAVASLTGAGAGEVERSLDE